MKILKNKDKFIFWAIFFLVLFLDLFSKYLIKNNFALGESIFIIKPFFNFTYVLNSGAAFGLFSKNTILLILVPITVITLFFCFQKQIFRLNICLQIAISLILAGTFGNLFNRILEKKVIDFLDFKIWPIFNLADVSIVIGTAIFIVFIFFNKEIHKKDD